MRLTEAEARVIIARFNRLAGRPEPLPGVAVRMLKATAGRSEIEESMAQQIKLLGLPEPVRQHKYLEDRRYRADFAWPQHKLALEVQGAVHRITGRFKAEFERRFLLQLHGWTVIEAGGDEVRSGRAAAWLMAMMEKVCP